MAAQASSPVPGTETARRQLGGLRQVFWLPGTLLAAPSHPPAAADSGICAAVVPGHSGGTAQDSHLLPLLEAPRLRRRHVVNTLSFYASPPPRSSPIPVRLRPRLLDRQSPRSRCELLLTAVATSRRLVDPALLSGGTFLEENRFPQTPSKDLWIGGTV